MLTICCSEDRADCMSGSRSGGRVRVTVLSRNSLAKTVWPVMDEVPSKADTPSSSPSCPYSTSGPSPVAGEEAAGPWAPLSVAATEGLRLPIETASSRIMPSMLASRDSKWSILRSLCRYVSLRDLNITPSEMIVLLLRGDEHALTALPGPLAGAG
jgi:hypothetical protein